MRKGLAIIFVAGLIILPLTISGCKGKVPGEDETAKMDVTELTIPTEEIVVTQSPMTGPSGAQVYVSQETIPPTASVPPASQSGRTVSTDNLEHNKEIQIALKAANFYAGNIDGKIGPKTRKAIIEFQKANGLKADGKAGPKTWTKLEKYLKRQ